MSTARQRRRAGFPALDLIEEAVALLRRAPASAHLAYYVGAMPFWLGVLYFVSDMGRDAYAASQLTDWSLGLALLYLWKKTWQTVSAAKLRATLAGVPDAPWTPGRIARTVALQAAIQPWGLLLRAVAAVITLPFVWVSAFFQNATVLGDGTPHSQSLASRCLTQAKLWPGQAHLAVSLVLVFTLFVWLNVTAALGAVPAMLKMLFGIESMYSRSGLAFMNTTFFAASFALTSLAVDPLRKAIFVLRCFQGAARHSGEDLTGELQRFARAALAAAALLFFAPVAYSSDKPDRPASSDTTRAAEIDRRIGEVLARREYAWRAPRAKEAAAKKPAWLEQWLSDAGKTIDKWGRAFFRQIGRFFRWIGQVFNPPKISTPSGPAIDWVGLSQAVLALLVLALLGVLGWALGRGWRPRRKTIVANAAAAVMPDLRSDDVVADQLPEDGWLVLAREHASRGELSLALRAAWLAGLAHLGQRELIRIARHKSNRDYERELRRRARDRAPLLAAFDDNLLSVERSWYGRHEVSADSFEAFQRNLERIRQS